MAITVDLKELTGKLVEAAGKVIEITEDMLFIDEMQQAVIKSIKSPTRDDQSTSRSKFDNIDEGQNS